MMTSLKVLCFGEVLMDQFPSSAKPGGAPLNVAYHMTNLGTPVAVMSSIGNDNAGNDLSQFMSSINLDVSLIQHHEYLPTGTVQVDISNRNDAKYTIVEGVAWDDIKPVTDYSPLRTIDYLVHGSLALRSKSNRDTLAELKINLNAKSVFDLNLRAPFYSEALLSTYISTSNIVKLNQEEFELLCSWLKLMPNEIGLEKLAQVYPNVEIFLLTRGSDGAWARTKDTLFISRKFNVDIIDTVGSGDSFLGSFVHCLSSGKSIQHSIDFASATGAFVASRSGANPIYSMDKIEEMLAL